MVHFTNDIILNFSFISQTYLESVVSVEGLSLLNASSDCKTAFWNHFPQYLNKLKVPV